MEHRLLGAFAFASVVIFAVGNRLIWNHIPNGAGSTSELELGDFRELLIDWNV